MVNSLIKLINVIKIIKFELNLNVKLYGYNISTYFRRN